MQTYTQRSKKRKPYEIGLIATLVLYAVMALVQVFTHAVPVWLFVFCVVILLIAVSALMTFDARHQNRELQAGWTIETTQDLNAQHGLDRKSEMIQALSAEIVRETEYETISDLFAQPGTVEAREFFEEIDRQDEKFHESMNKLREPPPA